MQTIIIIDFLKKQFPKRWYSFSELKKAFGVSRDTLYYWFQKYEIPTFKINNSPFVMQESLIHLLLKSNTQNYSEDRLVGFEFILEDLEQYQKYLSKQKTATKKPN